MSEKPDRTFTFAGLVVTLAMAGGLVFCLIIAGVQSLRGTDVSETIQDALKVLFVGVPSLLARTRPDPVATQTNIATSGDVDASTTATRANPGEWASSTVTRTVPDDAPGAVPL